MADVALNIQFPESDIKRMFEQITRAHTELGKPMKESLKWGGVYVCKSLSGSTKKSPKLRKVIKNPNPRAATDARMAKWGAAGYKKGQPHFIPIYKTGEFGKIRFTSKKTAEVMTYDKITGQVKRDTYSTGNAEFDMPGIMQSKKRIIGRSGFAKKVWGLAARFLFTDKVLSLEGVPNVAAVRWTGGYINPTLKISNRLRYALDALKGNGSEIDNAMAKAANSMMNRIDDAVKRKTGAK